MPRRHWPTQLCVCVQGNPLFYLFCFGFCVLMVFCCFCLFCCWESEWSWVGREAERIWEELYPHKQLGTTVMWTLQDTSHACNPSAMGTDTGTPGLATCQPSSQFSKGPCPGKIRWRVMEKANRHFPLTSTGVQYIPTCIPTSPNSRKKGKTLCVTPSL